MTDVLVLDNREFLVVKRRKVNDANYIYAIASDDSNDFTLLKEVGNNEVESVKDEDEARAILKIIAKESI